MLLAALGLGLAVGVVIGALGGGGSILTVPLLVYVLGLTAQEATTSSLVIVGSTSIVASVGHARSGHTRWRLGLGLAAVGVPTSVLGSRLNKAFDPDLLLLVFAAVMVAAALGMLLRPARDGAAAEQPASTPLLQLAAAGAGIGLLTGLLGVGGGFVIVPVLVLAMGLPMPVAVGTSLLVIALDSAVALLARQGHSTFDWAVVLPFTAAAIVGALSGERVSGRLPARALSRAFACLLLLVAAYVAVRAGSALS